MQYVLVGEEMLVIIDESGSSLIFSFRYVTDDILTWSQSFRLSDIIHISCISLKCINFETVATCERINISLMDKMYDLAIIY